MTEHDPRELFPGLFYFLSFDDLLKGSTTHFNFSDVVLQEGIRCRAFYATFFQMMKTQYFQGKTLAEIEVEKKRAFSCSQRRSEFNFLKKYKNIITPS